ncbi:MAG TPA: hypothetical protein VJ111_09475 [Chitinophagaceae bacterium]|nr:hypothetical protein [Chitinophagaceae bacterium]
MKKYFLFLVIILSAINAFAQFNQEWRGKKCAVVLTYDDALNVHLDNAIPLLDSFGLRGTFYLKVFFRIITCVIVLNHKS